MNNHTSHITVCNLESSNVGTEVHQNANESTADSGNPLTVSTVLDIKQEKNLRGTTDAPINSDLNASVIPATSNHNNEHAEVTNYATTSQNPTDHTITDSCQNLDENNLIQVRQKYNMRISVETELNNIVPNPIREDIGRQVRTFQRLEPVGSKDSTSNSDSISLNTTSATQTNHTSTIHCSSYLPRSLMNSMSDGNLFRNQPHISLNSTGSEVIHRTTSETNINSQPNILSESGIQFLNNPPLYDTRDSSHVSGTATQACQQSTTFGSSQNTFRINRFYRYCRSLIGRVESNSDSFVVYYAPPLLGAPPSYYRPFTSNEPHANEGSRNAGIMQVSSSFVPTTPPPSYAESQGLVADFPRSIDITPLQELIWGPEPTYVVCPNCNHVVLTSVRTRTSAVTHLSAVTLCFIGCWPCCFLPYCIGSCKKADHYCPQCRSLLGMYQPY